jgi:hypothetical protein
VLVKPTVKRIFEQLNRLLAEKVAQGEIIDHNLEKGMGTERAIRALLEGFLPTRFGVAKGKIVNYGGDMSQQCDVMIYDRLNCPKLFIDENDNQVLPIEGVYAVLEVKTTLTKHTLTEAFDNLYSVHMLQPERPVRSLNPSIDFRPPCLSIVGFRGIQLKTLKAHFTKLNSDYSTPSFSIFSPRSPGYADLTMKTFLVHDIACLGRGSIGHMLNGEVRVREWGEYTLGMLLTSLLTGIEQIPSAEVIIGRYFHYGMIEDSEFFKREMHWL